MEWWWFIQGYISAEYPLSWFSYQVSFSDCLFQSKGSETTRIDLMYTSSVFNMLYPIIVLIVYGILIVFQKVFSKSKSAIFDRYMSLVTITLWYIYPDLVHEFFKVFTCVELKDGSKRMFRDLEIMCWKNNHDSLTYFVGIPLLLLYVIGIPCIYLFKLYKNKETIKRILQNPDPELLDRKEKDEMKMVKLRYGFLFLGLSEPWYFWETIIIFRKLVVIFVTDFLTTVSQEVQCLIGIVVVM